MASANIEVASRMAGGSLSPSWEPATEESNRSSLSLVHGPTEPPLLNESLGKLLDRQAETYRSRSAIISWGDIRLSYSDLNERSKNIARGLIALGVTSGDRIGIFSGNCERYIELFFGVCRIGGILVVLNNTYTVVECINALKHSGCKLLFTSRHVGRRDLAPLLDRLAPVSGDVKGLGFALEQVVLIRGQISTGSRDFISYDDVLERGSGIPTQQLRELEGSTSCHDVCNFQFTSGTTGDPKAAMLSHHNIINNGRFIGDCMRLTEEDIICCPPPLYHCFGLVLGLLACITHGSAMVVPSETFDPAAVVRFLVQERCTGLHGVPTMFVAILQQHRRLKRPGIKLRAGIAAGTSIPRALMEELRAEFGLLDLVVTYGMTETSPASFMSSVDDPLDKKLQTVGKILPHTSAKVVDRSGRIVPRGVRGEICTAGYLLQKGYFNNPQKTAEVMIQEDGVLWMYTGDEGFIDEEGYCAITGRIKDMIIRGGENIYPPEIEDRLQQHPAILQSSIVGLRDKRYGEIVAAFLQLRPGHLKPSNKEVADWVRITLGNHKAPVRVFWLGDHGVPGCLPVTGSGKIQKNKLRDLGNLLIAKANL